jgi:hypothetical protein
MRRAQPQARRVNGHAPRRGPAASGQPGGATSGAGAPRTGGPACERAEPRARAAFRCATAYAVRVHVVDVCVGVGVRVGVACALGLRFASALRLGRVRPLRPPWGRASRPPFLGGRPRVRVRGLRARVRIRGPRARERPKPGFGTSAAAIGLKPPKTAPCPPFVVSLLSRKWPVYHHLTFDRKDRKMDA